LDIISVTLQNQSTHRIYFKTAIAELTNRLISPPLVQLTQPNPGSQCTYLALHLSGVYDNQCVLKGLEGKSRRTGKTFAEVSSCALFMPLRVYILALPSRLLEEPFPPELSFERHLI